LIDGHCGAEVGQGPGVAEFEGVGGVEEVYAFAVTIVPEMMRGRGRNRGEYRLEIFFSKILNSRNELTFVYK
jgi:hypothetical protein